MKPKKKRGIESLKSKYGMLFVLPWTLGIIFFVLIPIVQSISYSFSKISTDEYGIVQNFRGIKNYIYIVSEDPNFLSYLTSSILKLLYSLPAISVISIMIGIILNGKFRGRTFFRSLYFLPVIIATGVVMEWIMLCANPSLDTAGGSATSEIINITQITEALGLTGPLVEFFQTAISEIFTLVWSSGIQIILVIAGLQSIPDSLYEVSKVEGATKWEEFWFVTFPMLSRITLLVIIFTFVELVTDKTNEVMSYIYNLMTSLNYDESSAMLWMYLGASGLFMGIIVFAFNRLCMKRWE